MADTDSTAGWTAPSGLYNAAVDMVDRNVEEGRGDKAAFMDPRRVLTYAELQAACNRMANVLPRLGIGRERRIAMIMLDDVVYFRADSKYTVVATADGESLLRTPLKELLEVLDPRQFRQIHRSTIVNLKAVASVVRDDSGKGTLRLKGRSDELPVSVPYMALFRGM